MSDQPTKLTKRNTREENIETLKECVKENPERLKLKESISKKLGFDIDDNAAFPVRDKKFSWTKVEEKLQEADSASSFPQVLRAGVQNIMNAAYETVDTSFEDFAHVVQSSKDTELYAPLHGIQFPREVGRQETYPETPAAGLDIKLANRKYGQIFSVEKELLDDDQTGQFQKQVSLIGEYLKLVLEVLVYGKLASVAGMQYSNMLVPVSETKPSYEATWPWSTALRGGGASRPASYGAPIQANIRSAQIALMNQKNLLGLKMMINPNRVLIGPTYHFDLAVLLNSAYYPSVQGAAGTTGTNFAQNPLKGMFNLTVSRFMFKNDGTVNGDSTAWYLVDDSKPWMIVQVREAASVVTENPASGQSFDRDIMRFKGYTRCNADILDPRFAYQGSDGSA